MKENYESIIGKTFTGFKFSGYRQLSYDDQHQKCEGCEGVVKSLHSSFPKFALAKMTDSKGHTREIHYPAELIKAQVEEREEKERVDVMSVDDLLNEMKQLASII